MRTLLLLALATALTRPLCAQDSTAARLQQLMEAYAQVRGFNGSVLVARKGAILLDTGYGWRDAARRLPNDRHTQFQIASTTKTFTSTMILRLAAAGKLTLTDKLSRWYPEIPFADSVTIGHLLTHTSGIYDFTREPEPVNAADEQKMIAIFRSHPLDFRPDSDWRYSNSNYALLGHIVGKLSGQDYFREVQKTIFEPLHMHSSGFDFVHLHGKEKAIGYKVLTDSLASPDEISDSTGPFAAGAIYSTVEDLYRWHKGLEDGRALAKEWQEKAYHKALGRYNYGYGWTVDSFAGRRVVSHSGAISGFGSDFERVPEDDVCVVVLSNRSGSTFEVQNISRKLLAILYKQPYAIPHRWAVHRLSEADLQAYPGLYEFKEMGLVFRIWIEEGQLYGQSENRPGPRSTLLATGADHFITREDEDAEGRFVRDANGQVTAMEVKQRGMVKIAQKIN